MYAREAKIGSCVTVESQRRKGSEKEKGERKKRRRRQFESGVGVRKMCERGARGGGGNGAGGEKDEQRERSHESSNRTGGQRRLRMCEGVNERRGGERMLAVKCGRMRTHALTAPT